MVLRLDHLVLTCADVDATVNFYERVLGFRDPSNLVAPFDVLFRDS